MIIILCFCNLITVNSPYYGSCQQLRQISRTMCVATLLA
jgi:hypothetical protein